jgi:hypothetical protein
VLTRVRIAIKDNRVLLAIYRTIRFALDHTIWNSYRLEIDRQWAERRRDAVGCPDNVHIPRVADAGVSRNGVQIMHNGLKIRRDSYYGKDITRMLAENGGVHEPQEERVFREALGHVRADGVMIELGAYWGFYSMWFLAGNPRRRAVLVEPEREHLEMGLRNFRLNGLQGEFIQAFAGASSSTDRYGRRTVSVDDLVAEHRIERLDILHSDIQGFEAEMLEGAARSFRRRLVDYVFISTHSQAIHETCRERLKSNDYVILADADAEDTYSVDGLLVGRRQELPGLERIPISLKTRDGYRR